MANTTNIDLAKPAGTDHALISVLNSNSDKIDAEAGRQRGNFAGTYSSTSGYAVGDYCIYQGNLYRCTTAIGSSGENWTAGHWTSVKVGTELKGLSDQIASKSANLASNFNIYRFGNVIYVSCVGGNYNKDADSKITDSSNNVIPIPNGYRPISAAELWDCLGSKRITAAPEGYFTSAATVSSSPLRFSGCWITNDAMPS